MQYETITKSHESRYRHKSKAAGFAGIHLIVSPTNNKGFLIDTSKLSAPVDPNFLSAMMRGMHSLAAKGLRRNCGLKGVSVEVISLEVDPHTSTEQAFENMGFDSLRLACLEANPVFIEDD